MNNAQPDEKPEIKDMVKENAEQFLLEVEISSYVNGNVYSPNINIFNVPAQFAFENAVALAKNVKIINGILDNENLARQVVNLVLNGASISHKLLDRGSTIVLNDPGHGVTAEMALSRLVDKLVQGLSSLRDTTVGSLSLGPDAVRKSLVELYKDNPILHAVKIGELLGKAAGDLVVPSGPNTSVNYMVNVKAIRDYYWKSAVDKDRWPDPVINYGSVKGLEAPVETGDSIPFEQTSTKVVSQRDELDDFMTDVDHVLGVIGNASGKIDLVRTEIIRNWMIANNYLPEIHGALTLLHGPQYDRIVAEGSLDRLRHGDQEPTIEPPVDN